MPTIDLKNVYYSVKIDGNVTYFLKFLCNSKPLKVAVLLNGLSPGPWKFTKLTKSPLAMLRMQGYAVTIYIDSIIAIAQRFKECLLRAIDTINLFQELGFVIHLDKSNFIPAKTVGYLAFIIDSERELIFTNFAKTSSRKNYWWMCNSWNSQKLIPSILLSNYVLVWFTLD